MAFYHLFQENHPNKANLTRKHELINNVLLCYEGASVGRPAITYLKQLYTDTRCSLEDLLEAMDDIGEWRERVREIRVSATAWW